MDVQDEDDGAAYTNPSSAPPSIELEFPHHEKEVKK
jgi:hypothetical protein